MELVKITILAGYILLVFVNAKQKQRILRPKDRPNDFKKIWPYIDGFQTRTYASGYGKRNGYLHGVKFDLKQRLFPANVLPLTAYHGHEPIPGYLQEDKFDKTMNLKDRLLNSDWSTNSGQFQDSNTNLYPASGYFYPRNIPISDRDTDYEYPETDEYFLRGSRSRMFQLSDKRYGGGWPWETISALYNSPDK